MGYKVSDIPAQAQKYPGIHNPYLSQRSNPTRFKPPQSRLRYPTLICLELNETLFTEARTKVPVLSRCGAVVLLRNCGGWKCRNEIPHHCLTEFDGMNRWFCIGSFVFEFAVKKRPTYSKHHKVDMKEKKVRRQGSQVAPTDMLPSA